MASLLAPIENTPYVGGAANSFITLDVNGLQVTLTGIDGELVTWSAAGVPETVAAGTAGQILTSNGAGSAPTFQTGGGGGINNVVEDTSPQYGGVMDTNSFALDESEGTPVANAASMDIWATDGNTLHITGSTGPTTSLGTAARVGAWRKCVFDSTPTWNDGADIILPGSANFTFAADDIAYIYAETTTQFRVLIFKGDGTAVVGGGGAQTPWASDIDQNGFSITDGAGLEILSFVETASAVNEITIANAATGGSPVISATGGDSDIPVAVKPKGAQAFFDIDSDSATSDSILRFKINGASQYVFGFDESSGNLRLDVSTTGSFPGSAVFTQAGAGQPVVFSPPVRMASFMQGSTGQSLIFGNSSSAFIDAPTSGNILLRDSSSETLVEIGATGDLSFGLDDATPTVNTVQGQSGSGTDIAGADINLAGGQGTGTGVGGNVVIQVSPAGTTGSSPNALVDAIEIDSAQNVRLSGSAAHATTAGTGIISLFNGTAPVGTLTDGASFYVAAGQMTVIQADGVATAVSPHDPETGEWIFHSKNTVTGRTLKVRMEELMKRLAKLVGPELFEEFYDDLN